MFALAPQAFRVISIIPASLGRLKTKLFAPIQLHHAPSIDIWKSRRSPDGRGGTCATSFSLLGSTEDFKYVLLDFGPLLRLSSQRLKTSKICGSKVPENQEKLLLAIW